MTKGTNVEDLLKKYYDGQTTEGEEKELAGMLCANDVPDGLKDERETFMALHCGMSPTPLPGLEERLGQAIDRMAAAQVTPPRRTNAIARIRTVGGMAASVAAVAALGIYLNLRMTNADIGRMDKYALAQDAIMKFSYTLNKGLEQMDEAQAKTYHIGTKINKCIKMDGGTEK